MPLIDNDHIDRLAGLRSDGSLARLRHARDTVRAASQASFEAIFETPAVDGLSAVERELAAQRVAVLQQHSALAELHRGRARALGADAGTLTGIELRPRLTPDSGDRLSAILSFVDRLTLNPASATPAHLQALQQRGLAAPAIVALAQAVAFTSYALRLLAGLRALSEAGDAELPAAQGLQAGRNTLQAVPPAKGRFTLQALEWQAWLPTVDIAQATPEQAAVLDESNAAARSSPYYLTLVHNPAVLRQRSKLLNAIMYGAGGLPRAERELATVAVSRINGCPYCASVHARPFAQLSKEPEVIERLFADGVNTPLNARRRAIVDLAVDLSANPPVVAPNRVAELRGAGLDDVEILDVIHAAAIFAWANRLMQTLGEPVGPEQG